MDRIILAENFSEEQKKLAKELLDQLMGSSESLSEFSCVFVYGLVERGSGTSILFEISYSDPEDDGNITIFDSY